MKVVAFMIHPTVIAKLPELTHLFKNHGVQKAFLFGSVVTDAFNENSDIDILIEPDESEPDPVQRGEVLWSLYFNLKEVLQRDIDLVTRRSLSNAYFIAELNRTCVAIYG